MSFYPLIISLFLFQSLANSSQNTTSIGVTIDVNSETGKQHRTAMQIAAQSFNIHYNNQNLVIFFRDSGRNPLQAASVAEELITKEKVKVIIGMETWQEAALVADLGAKFQVPIISFSSPPSVPSSLVQLRWPFLIQMSQNLSAQMNFIADMIHAFNSQKVIVIYEDNPYSSESGMLSLLSEALEKFNLQIEYLLALPPFTSLSDPKGFVLDELLKLLPLKSRVFVVLQASLPSPEETESLTLDKFWGLYVICAATSTICLLLALLKKRLRNHNHYEEADQLPQGSVISESDDDNNNNSQRAIRVGTGLNIENLIKLNKSATFGGRVKEGVRRRNSPKLESISISDEQGDLPHSQSAAMP